MRAILDTSVLVSSVPPPGADDYAISIVSIAEMQFGVLKAAGTPAQAARLRRLSEIEHEFDPIPVDHRVAWSYAQCAHAITSIGRSPRPRVLDLLIAATANAEHARLYTWNPQDFVGLEDLVEVAVPPA